MVHRADGRVNQQIDHSAISNIPATATKTDVVRWMNSVWMRLYATASAVPISSVSTNIPAECEWEKDTNLSCS